MIKQGQKDVKNSGDLGGRPTIIIHGRMDNLIHVNHSSRAYLGLNALKEGQKSNLHYYEVKHGQHFDSLSMLPFYAPQFVPMHYYLEQALDLMMDHLKKGTPLPPSQLIPTVQRGAGAPPLELKNLPPLLNEPGKYEIKFDGERVIIPE